MSFCLLAYKAYRLNKKLNRYEREKNNAVRIKNGLTPIYTLSDKYHHFWIRCRRNTCFYARKMFLLSPNSRLQQFFVKLRMDGTFENYVAKSVLGFFGIVTKEILVFLSFKLPSVLFLCGIILTYVFLMFFVVQMNFSIMKATMWCSLFGIILTLGLAFSHVVRVVVFLLLPQFFSKRGRQALMAYAFVLALTGPAKNTLRNTEIMSESLACGQEQLKAAVRQIKEAIKKPFMAIKDAFRKVMKIIKLIIKKIKAILIAIKRIVVSILRVIKSLIQWLGSIVNICNKKMGTPFQRCMRVFDGAVVDCKAKLGPLFNWLCSLAYVVSLVCYVVKILDLICMLLDFINDNVIGVVKRKIQTFVTHIRNIFYVSVEFKHSFHFETNQSVSMREIAAGMVTEIRQRTEKFLTVFDVMSSAFSLLFLYMIFNVIQYRIKFMTNDRFDNRFITSDFHDIDLRRAKHDQETILPLNKRERRQYIRVRSIRLVSAEKVKLTKSAVFLGLTSFKLSIHMVTDYCLYWLLLTIRRHGSVRTTVEAPNMVGIQVQGEGVLADLYRSVAKAFKPLGIKMDVDTVPCLPNPIPPDFGRYIQIASVIVLCWVMAVLEPYGLRLRHVVMCYYYPDRARQRSVWLYNHILRSRGTFLKFARRQLRRKFGKSKDGVIEKVTLMDKLRDQFPFLNIILGKSSQKSCFLCGRVVREGDKEQLIKCQTPNCPGQYCVSCFSELMNICPVCKKPIEYGDLSDMSIERDSSDDDDDDHQSPQPQVNNRRESQDMKDVISDQRRAEDVELGLLSGNESQDDNRSMSSELSYSYQQDVQNDVNARKTPLETRPPFRDLEAQPVFEPASTQIFNESEDETEDQSSPEEERRDLKDKRKREKSFPFVLPDITSMFIFKRKKKADADTKKLLSEDSDESLVEETDAENLGYDTVASCDSEQNNFAPNSLYRSVPDVPITQAINKTRSEISLSLHDIQPARQSTSTPSIKSKDHNAVQREPEFPYKSGSFILKQAKSSGVSINSLEEDSTTGLFAQQIPKDISEARMSTKHGERGSFLSERGSSMSVYGREIDQLDMEPETRYFEDEFHRDNLYRMSKINDDGRLRNSTEFYPSNTQNQHYPARDRPLISNKESRFNILRTKTDSKTPLEQKNVTSEDETWSEMSSEPFHSEDEMETYRKKPEARTREKQSSSKDSKNKLKFQLKQSIINIFDRIVKPRRASPKVLTEYVREKGRKLETTRITSKESCHKNKSPHDRKEIKSDHTALESAEESSESEFGKPRSLAASDSEISTAGSCYDEDDVDDLSEGSEKQPLLRTKPIKEDRFQRTQRHHSELYHSFPGSAVNCGLSSKPSLERSPISGHSQATQPTDHEQINLVRRKHFTHTSMIKSDKTSNVREEKASAGKIYQGKKGKERTKSKIQVPEESSSTEEDEDSERFNEGVNWGQAGSPIPGQPPLFDFDTLTYQAHEGYFNLVTELKDKLELQRKTNEPCDATAPDLIQEERKQISSQTYLSQPSTSSYRAKVPAKHLPPDIVPRTQSKTHIPLQPRTAENEEVTNQYVRAQIERFEKREAERQASEQPGHSTRPTEQEGLRFRSHFLGGRHDHEVGKSRKKYFDYSDRIIEEDEEQNN